MAWFETFSLVMRSNATALVEKLEDPERVLHQLILDMEEEHERVRQSVARAIADEVMMRGRAKQARDEAGTWLDRATEALKRGDERDSRAALEQKHYHTKRAEALEREYEQQSAQTAELQSAVADLDDKIRQARQRQTLLLARLARADANRRVERSLRRVDRSGAMSHFARLERRVECNEALGEAYRRLDGEQPDAQALKRKLDGEARKAEIDSELEMLRQRLDAAVE